MWRWYREKERNSTKGMDMYIGGVEIEQSQNIKLLGIDIDS